MNHLKYRNTYRIPSARLGNYDYSQSGAYFVTICTENRKKFFGEIAEEKMTLTEIGKIVGDVWEKLPVEFPIVELDEWIVMPNHFHGVVMIANDGDAISRDAISRDAISRDAISRDAINGVSTRNICRGVATQYNPMLGVNLSRAIRWFKGRSCFEVRKKYPEFQWQSRFYDHVIRNELDFDRVRKYIVENPIAWGNDEYFS